jgi:hypothetical protein
MLPLEKQIEIYRYEVRMQVLRDQRFRALRRRMLNEQAAAIRRLEDYENNRMVERWRKERNEM